MAHKFVQCLRNFARPLGVKLPLTLMLVFCLSFLSFLYDSIVVMDKAKSALEVVESTFRITIANDSGTSHCVFGSVTTRPQRDILAGSRMCLESRRPQADHTRTEQPWQRFSTDRDDIIVYRSALFDDRPAVGVLPWLRIQALANLANTKHFCQVWYSNCRAPYVVPLDVRLTGRKRGYQLNGKNYTQYLFSCRLPGLDPTPSHVSIVGEHRCAQSTIFLPVEKPVRAEPDHQFGVCVAISFGSVPVEEFVEWIELHRILGVTEFNVYDAGMTGMSKVFDYYTSRGLLVVHQMPPPIAVDGDGNKRPTNSTGSSTAANLTMDSIKVSSPASLNDCMLRNSYRYRYTIVIDFDEVVVPRLHTNYTQLMANVVSKYLNHLRDGIVRTSFMFRNAYFFLNFDPVRNQPALRIAKYRHRANVSPAKFAPKSFIDPQTCLVVFNHYCLIPLAPVSVSSTLVDVSPDIATSHHYRRCGFKADRCNQMFKEKTRDDIAMTYSQKLLTNVAEVLQRLNSTDNSRTG